MKKKLSAVAALLLSLNVHAADDAEWMRYAAISPDGTQIAFSFKGDIYTVSAQGGRAYQLTTNPAHDTRPVWSPDGQKIAFVSDRRGNPRIFISDTYGRNTQLIPSIGNDAVTPAWSKDGKIA